MGLLASNRPPPFSIGGVEGAREQTKLRPNSLQLALSWLHLSEVADTGKVVMPAKKRPPTSPEPPTSTKEKVPQQPPRKRFSIFKPKAQQQQQPLPPPAPNTAKLLNFDEAKPSLLAYLRKLLTRSPKKRAEGKRSSSALKKKASSSSSSSAPTSLSAKASSLYDEDDGMLDDATLQISVNLYEGGLPPELVNSPLRVTYINSVRKLQVRQHRSLHQLLLINSVVSRLQGHVADRGMLFSTPSHPLSPLAKLDSPREYRGRPVLMRKLSVTSRRNHSEPDLTLPPISPNTEKRLHRLSDPCL